MARFFDIFGRPVPKKCKVKFMCGRTMINVLHYATDSMEHVATVPAVHAYGHTHGQAFSPLFKGGPVFSRKAVKAMGGFAKLYEYAKLHREHCLHLFTIERLKATGDKSVEECVIQSLNEQLGKTPETWQPVAGVRMGSIPAEQLEHSFTGYNNVESIVGESSHSPT